MGKAAAANAATTANATVASSATNSTASTTANADKTNANETTQSKSSNAGPTEPKPAEAKATAPKAVRKSKSTVTPPKKFSTNQAAPPQRKISAPPKSSTPENQQAGTTNGNSRKISKSKWVPLEIDVPKARSSKARERPSTSNATNSKRRGDPHHDGDAADGERSRRPRAPSNRSTTSSTRPSGAAGSSRATSGGSGRASANSGKRPPRAAGGVQKTRPPRTSAEFNLDYPIDFAQMKKLIASGQITDGTAPFLLPYMGTFYYNGVPSYANMDVSSLKEAIKKQM